MAPFFSKKAKAEMRSRKRRKQNAATADEIDGGGSGEYSQTSNGTKRAANEMQSTSDDSDEPRNKKAKMINGQVTIIVPSNLTAKEAKKFRKDERRKARADGVPDDKIQFKSQGQHQSDEPSKELTESTTKKPKKSFPRINDLLSQHATQKKLQEQTAKQSAINDAVPSSEKEKYIAIDCEMVGVGSSGSKSALARASAVDWEGNILLDTFVQVPERVTDFRTHVSGVRSKDISPKNDKAMTHSQVRQAMEALLMDKILVGHALKNDLSVLLISHPKKDTRDTAKYKPFMRPGRVGGKMRPRKLRDLVWENCGLEIQRKGVGHSSVEDARASMELFKCVRGRWEKELIGKSLGGGSRGKK
ncbi:hypothetical protein ACHAWO_006340 [Cyclotella atomus]|uniref:RNA exonuclease 4 n=1 Tax=Cyclotella atomus TaxID=382360 RepID=A0ABD3NM39_9STRA